MGGILKNALPKEETHSNHDGEQQSISEFRKQVYENTQLNAQLTSRHRNTPFEQLHLNVEGENGDSVEVPLSPGRRKGPPKDTLLMKREHDAREKAKKEGDTSAMTEEERLQWNQKNLDENEITKQQFQDIHVDEPKTPYQGAVDPEGEYYRVDDEDDDDTKKDDIDDFSLGEPEYKVDETSNQDDDVEVEDVEAKHKKFEEMRKKHYNVKEIFQNKKKFDDEDEDDEE
ncbi:Protein GLC8 [Nakaseomyces bracarensis]|uniref:Protein GLC8 n=1 Tax=Nakaseomyces bracarensis TaxID=273131 RepID=A0ABR4NRH1_9SACH